MQNVKCSGYTNTSEGEVVRGAMSIPGLQNFPFSEICINKADLRSTTLMHATSLRQAYDMTWNILNAYDIFTYKIKYAKVCTGIYGAKKF